MGLAKAFRRVFATVEQAQKHSLEGFVGGLENTPDATELELKEGHLLFVPDEMMTGCRYHGMLDDDDSMLLYNVVYTNRPFSMFTKKLGKQTYPVVLPPYEDAPGLMNRVELAPVRGQLYLVTHHKIYELDKHKNNTVTFHRQRVFLDIPYRKVEISRREWTANGQRHFTNTPVMGEWKHHKTQDAWMYIGDPEYFFWSGYAEKTFRPVKLKVPADRNLKPYYQYKEDAV